MGNQMAVGLTVFVEHGREREAASFLKAAFGATEVENHGHKGSLVAVDLLLGFSQVSIAGSNPRREADPTLGGPFYPKGRGDVRVIIRLDVPDVQAAVERATAAGAVVRDQVQEDASGKRVAAVFDPFGHIWGLIERRSEPAKAAA